VGEYTDETKYMSMRINRVHVLYEKVFENDSKGTKLRDSKDVQVKLKGK
jgi:hypothetical protein